VSTFLAFLRALTKVLESLLPLIKELAHEAAEKRRHRDSLSAALGVGSADDVAAAWDRHDELLPGTRPPDSAGEDGDTETGERELRGERGLDGASSPVRACDLEAMP